MRKKISDEFITRAKKREIKKRPRMRVHSGSLKKGSAHSGKSLTNR